MSLALAKIMQLSDSALPVGGYAFSHGIECALKMGVIQSIRSLKSFIQGQLEQVADFDLPYIGSFYQNETIDEIATDYDIMMTNEFVRLSSIEQGKGWLRIIKQIYPDINLSIITKLSTDNICPPHILVVMALTLKQQIISLSDLCTLYLFMQLRDQLSAAVRLGAIGSIESQCILAEIETTFPKLLERFGNKRAGDAVRTTVLADIMQANHGMLYSKIFRN